MDIAELIAQMQLGNKRYGYEVRNPYGTELEYFRGNPAVSGMAAQDDRIILNPFSNLTAQQRESVIKNEAARLLMRQMAPPLDVNITPQQRESFQGTPYQDDSVNMLQTILARIISGDPSSGAPTNQQTRQADWLSRILMSR